MPNNLDAEFDRFTDHSRDGNTPIIVIPDIPEFVIVLAIAMFLEATVLLGLWIVATLIWIGG